ncbi:MAG: hypothetical protein H6712_32285 [Myxococcales bacterium]|nr:hypothetical protein [Myxococcales bacterium]MCB9718574.1 hypothetical protein [Myxococcales bacterium]
MLRISLLSMTLLAVSCTDSGDDGDTDAADGSGTGNTVGGVPVDAGELSMWLEAGSYSSWAAESGNHASTGPHGEVRTFFNDEMVASFDAGNTVHPVGSAAVKELYNGSGAEIGWAVMVKVAEGEGANSWYWYLESSDTVTADGEGIPTCENCHVSGTDRVLTPYPLQ